MKSSYRKPVYIFGKPGLEENELAALIHSWSARRRQPLAQIDCAQLRAGRADKPLGIAPTHLVPKPEIRNEKGLDCISCRTPIYIFGEPGLEKDELAALIHFGSARRRQPMARIDCSHLNIGRADDLLGSAGKQGLLAQLDGGTLLLNNVHQVLPFHMRSRQAEVPHKGYSVFSICFRLSQEGDQCLDARLA